MNGTTSFKAKWEYFVIKKYHEQYGLVFVFMVFNATFNNISVLLVEETRGPGENHRPAASHWQTSSHNVVHLALSGVDHTTTVVIDTNCIGSCKSNQHTITATTANNKETKNSFIFLHFTIYILHFTFYKYVNQQILFVTF